MNKSSPGVWLLIIGLLLSPAIFIVFAPYGQADAGGFGRLIAIVFYSVPAVCSILCILLGIAKIVEFHYMKSVPVNEEAELHKLRSNLIASKIMTFIVIALEIGLAYVTIIYSMHVLSFLILRPLLVPANIILLYFIVINIQSVRRQNIAITDLILKNNLLKADGSADLTI